MSSVARQLPDFQFDLSGGQLALDLANTISWRGSPQRRKDHLQSYSDLVAFARQAGVLAPRQAAELRSYAQQHPAEARKALRTALALREAAYRVFLAIAQKKAVAARDLNVINDCALEALRHRRLVPANGAYRWEWRTDGRTPLERVAWASAQAAAQLLTSEDLRTVRFCEAPDCRWLFLDHSRNRSRRWCDMKVCGNRQKARRHYRRTHE